MEIVKTEIVDEETTEMLATIPQSNDVDIQIATAHRYPRSIKRSQDAAITMATLDEETAASCFYVLPRGGKKIEGPSIRLAEIIASTWQNIRYSTEIVKEDDRFVYAEATVHDLETNVAAKAQTRRRITDRYGKRYNDDMIMTTANAACSVALRNVLFKVIPRSYVDSVYKKAKEVAIGNAQTLDSRRHKMIDAFSKMGVDPKMIYENLNVSGLEEIGLDKMEELVGLYGAIKDGQISIDQAFAKPEEEISEGKNKTEALANKIKKKK